MANLTILCLGPNCIYLFYSFKDNKKNLRVTIKYFKYYAEKVTATSVINFTFNIVFVYVIPNNTGLKCSMF